MENYFKSIESRTSWKVNHIMGFYLAGLDTRLESSNIENQVSADHPLLQISNALPWPKLAELALMDLKQTTCGFWWVGRKLNMRVHLAIFMLQTRFNFTDRKMEEHLRFNSLYQLYCGKTLFKDWHCPEYTAICKFRVRLKPETQRQILVEVLKTADMLGFVDPSWMDIDSTVQEANVAYPSDANLLLKMSKTGAKILNFIKQKFLGIIPKEMQIDLKAISKKAKGYFFAAKNTAIHAKRKLFKELFQSVKIQMTPLIKTIMSMNSARLDKLPGNIKKCIGETIQNGAKYLQDVNHFVKTNTIKNGKLLSFQLKEVACIVKGKLGKAFEFGRNFQLGRIGGNFFMPLACTNIRMPDKKSVLPFLREHAKIFGEGVLNSIGSDRGYFSKINVLHCAKNGVTEIGIQCPGKNLKASKNMKKQAQVLRDRRAGIEPLIGHVKQMGLKRSRMRSDQSTLASGYRSVLAFNLLQMERHQKGVIKKGTGKVA